MDVRERILTIRLIEKANANPACAQALGIVATSGMPDSSGQTEA